MGDNGIRTHRKKSMSFSKSSLAAHKAISAKFNPNILISFYVSKYRSNHCFINKANVNRGSRNGMTCIQLDFTIF